MLYKMYYFRQTNNDILCVGNVTSRINSERAFGLLIFTSFGLVDRHVILCNYLINQCTEQVVHLAHHHLLSAG